jgi:hypothetical protein
MINLETILGELILAWKVRKYFKLKQDLHAIEIKNET